MASGSQAEVPGVEYQRALQLSILLVHPSTLDLACHGETKQVLKFIFLQKMTSLIPLCCRMIPTAPFYLGANPISIADLHTTAVDVPGKSSEQSIRRIKPLQKCCQLGLDAGLIAC